MSHMPGTSMAETVQKLLPTPSRWSIGTTSVVSLALFIWLYRRRLAGRVKRRDATATDPGLLQKGTTFESYKTASGHVYPRIRTFYHEHPQAKKLPNDLPLLVFMHGLGGSAAQFAPLLTSMVNVAPCLAIDLPGCGRSDFKPNDPAAYTTTAFAELLFAAIDRFRNKEIDQKVVLVGHSMGCSIGALLASAQSPLARLCSSKILGMIAICPRSTTLTQADLLNIERLNWIWSPIFDLIRLADRRGGLDSKSVLRVVGKDADHETKKLQLRFNQQSKSAVFQKVLMGIYLQEKAIAEKGGESLLGRRIWSGVKVPLFLIAAKSDHLAPPKEVEQIADWLTQKSIRRKKDSKFEDEVAPDEIEPMPAVAGDVDMAQQQISQGNESKDKSPETHPRQHSIAIEENDTSTKHAIALKTTIFPEPASHGLLYATKDVRVLSGLIEGFLAKHIDKRLSPGWQLSHMTTSGKWDVKNLAKWQKIDECSYPIGGVFRAMKTMREIDDSHNPREFVKKYSYKAIPDGVAMIVDISHDVPVYNKDGLEAGGVEYHKFPTVSKQPPTEEEVEHFIDLVNSLRQSPKIQKKDAQGRHPTVGVHCHYGFNRTGFFIVAYLVEHEKWKLEDAIEEFAKKRPPGIKHEWFVDQLYTRYAVRIERRGTIVG